MKLLNIPKNKFYRDVNFYGKFKVPVNHKNAFLMYHFGGTLENETYWNGLFATYEEDTGWIWIQLCKYSNVIFDIGANTGLYSLVAKCINKECKVYAFEPAPRMFERLQINNEANNYNIKCEQIALSNVSGEQTFYDTPGASEYSGSLSADKLKNWDGYKDAVIEYKVKTQTLSDYIVRNNISGIDLIKMDIELHEPEAIEGFGKYLEQFKPVVVIEVLTEKAAASLNRLIGKDFIRLHLNAIESVRHVDEFEFVPYQYNYLFFHKDREAELRANTTLKW